MLRIFFSHITVPAAILAAFEFLILSSLLIVLPLVGVPGIVPKIPLTSLDSQLLGLTAAVNCLIMISVGLYHRTAFFDVKRVLFRVALSLPITIVIVSVFIVLYSRFQGVDVQPYYALAAISITALYLEVGLVRSLVIDAEKISVFKKRVLVLGSSERAVKIVNLLDEANIYRFEIVGISPIGDENLPPEISNQNIVKTVGGRSDLMQYVRQNMIDEIVIAVRDRRRPKNALGHGLPIWDLLECKMEGVRVSDYATFFEEQVGRLDLNELQPSWLIFGEGFKNRFFDNIVERVFDLVSSLTILVLTLPVFIMTTVMVKLTSQGPVFYRQERVGRGNKVFEVLKFRSMKVDAESDGVPKWAQTDDDRTTAIGNFLRRTRIDELPQLINVIRGEMSLVGPRPERPYFTEQLAKKIPYYNERHYVRPGITGWAQVNYSYGASEEDAHVKLSYDLYYLKHRGLILDLVTILQTIRVLLWAEGSR